MLAVWILAIAVLVILFANIKIVPQTNAFVIERLGAYQSTWGVGLHIKVPLIDRVAKRVTLKEQVVDFEPPPVITSSSTAKPPTHPSTPRRWTKQPQSCRTCKRSARGCLCEHSATRPTRCLNNTSLALGGR